MKTITTYIIVIIAAILVTACSDIFEKDISTSEMTIITPSDGQTTDGDDILFWWEYLSGADEYDMQIVAPDFSAVETLLTDITIDTNKVSFSLDPGTYQWRIRACNSAYCTEYIYRSFTVTTK